VLPGSHTGLLPFPLLLQFNAPGLSPFFIPPFPYPSVCFILTSLRVPYRFASKPARYLVHHHLNLSLFQCSTYRRFQPGFCESFGVGRGWGEKWFEL
jgi:hypothetical protein